MIRRPPRSTLSSSSAASDVYKRQLLTCLHPIPEQHRAHRAQAPILFLLLDGLDRVGRYNCVRRTLSGVYTGPEEFPNNKSSYLNLPGRLPPRAPTLHLCQGYRCRTSTSLAGKPPCCCTEDTWHGGFLLHWPTWRSGASEIVLLGWKTNLATQLRWKQALQHLSLIHI